MTYFELKHDEISLKKSCQHQEQQLKTLLCCRGWNWYHAWLRRNNSCCYLLLARYVFMLSLSLPRLFPWTQWELTTGISFFLQFPLCWYCTLVEVGIIFLVWFNVQAMPNRYHERLEQETARHWGRVALGLSKIQTGGPSPCFPIRWRLTSSLLSHFQSPLLIQFLRHICRLSTTLMWQMTTPGHGNSDSSRTSISTTLPMIGGDSVLAILISLFS